MKGVPMSRGLAAGGTVVTNDRGSATSATYAGFQRPSRFAELAGRAVADI